jgi:RNA polymerase sigma-70 factor (ECF subfamily)
MQDRQKMVFSKSITFGDEKIGRAEASAQPAYLNVEGPVFIDKLRDGDAAAFDILIDRYSPEIYALLFRLTENAEEASDLTQETFLRALRSIGSFRGDAEIKTWLYRIAINQSRNRFRWWKRRKQHMTISLDAAIGNTDQTVSDSIADESRSPEDNTLAAEREYALKAALLDLPEVYREAIILCDVEGLSYEETSVSLGVSLGTVKSRISRGREELRRRLKDF